MGGDLSAGCGRKSIAFSTPFEAALKIIAKGKWLHIIIATGLTPMAIFESNGLYDLLSLMRHDGTMQNILISRYPILLIDESQDTKKELVDALFTVCERHKGKFIVGMFGDTMQRAPR